MEIPPTLLQNMLPPTLKSAIGYFFSILEDTFKSDSLEYFINSEKKKKYHIDNFDLKYC